MRDPHVERLQYDIGCEHGTAYNKPPPLDFTNVLGHFTAEDGNLIVEPVDHFTSDGDAREAIQPFLRGWEIETDLKSNVGTIRFKFVRAEVIDRDPPGPSERQAVSATAAEVAIFADVVSALITHNAYPDPPNSFRFTSDVDSVYRRWRGYKAGKEPLLAMAYFVLTALEFNAGGSRARAASAFAIDQQVLRTIGKLSSERGDASTARKFPKTTSFRDLSRSERHWMEHAIRLVIRRMGERASGAPLAPITMSDLPTIDP